MNTNRGAEAPGRVRSFSKSCSPFNPGRLKSHRTTSKLFATSCERASSALAAPSTFIPRAERPSCTISRILSSSSTMRAECPVNADDSGETASERASGLGASARISTGTGRMTRNVAPLAGNDWTSILPPCSFATARQMVRPRPVPPPGRLVVKNGSKILPRFSDEIPGPSSAKVVITFPPEYVREIFKLPRSRTLEMACSALVMIFKKTCVRSLESPSMAGRLSGASSSTVMFFCRSTVS